MTFFPDLVYFGQGRAEVYSGADRQSAQVQPFRSDVFGKIARPHVEPGVTRFTDTLESEQAYLPMAAAAVGVVPDTPLGFKKYFRHRSLGYAAPVAYGH